MTLDAEDIRIIFLLGLLVAMAIAGLIINANISKDD